MHEPILLETERLTLRMFTPDDIEDLHLQLTDPEVMDYYPKVSSREDSEKWLLGILRDYETHGFGMLAIILKETGEFVGQIGIMRRVREDGEHHYFSYLLHKRFWGQGYASEAARRLLDHGFHDLGIHKVMALIRTDNARSIRLAERLGMRHESMTELGGFEHHVYVLTR